MTLFKNAKVILADEIKPLEVLTDNEKIVKIGESISADGCEVIDCEGNFLSPGFIDLHVHGGGGISAMCCDSERLAEMCIAHARHGTTSILPTTLAAPVKQLLEVTSYIKEAEKICPTTILGVHFEGPYLSPESRGAQSEENILSPLRDDPTPLLECWDKVKIMGVAPEIDGAMELGKQLSKRGIVASIAHTKADYDTALAAFDNGFSDITHIYNACTSCFKRGIFRVAGVVEAALTDDRCTAQVIADLKHLPLGVLKLIYKCKGADGMYLITDGLEFSAAGLKEGEICMQENGVPAVFEDGVMKLADRSCLAGSASTMDILVRNMYKSVGVPLYEAVKMASATPARVVGVDSEKGYIKEGCDADLLIFDNNINIKKVMAKGKFIS